MEEGSSEGEDWRRRAQLPAKFRLLLGLSDRSTWSHVGRWLEAAHKAMFMMSKLVTMRAPSLVGQSHVIFSRPMTQPIYAVAPLRRATA